MFLGKIEKDTVGFATFLLKLFKTGFGLSVSGYPKCILNVSYSGASFVFSCLNRNQAIVTYKSQAPTPLSFVLSYLHEFLEKNQSLYRFGKRRISRVDLA